MWRFNYNYCYLYRKCVSIAITDAMRFVVADTNAGAGVTARFAGTITNVSVTGSTIGIEGDFQSDDNLIANNRAVTNLREFNVGDSLDATTVFPGVSERLASSGAVPTLMTGLTRGIFIFTDRYNGRLPEGTTVTISSNNQTGCSLTSVGGTAINFPNPGPTTGGEHSGVVTVGQDVTTVTSFTVQTGGGGRGAITSTVTTPSGAATVDTISCNLLF